MGDSLINHPCIYFDLFARVQSNLNEKNSSIKYNITMINYGLDSHTIADIIQAEMNNTIAQKPDGVILLWDSDFRCDLYSHLCVIHNIFI